MTTRTYSSYPNEWWPVYRLQSPPMAGDRVAEFSEEEVAQIRDATEKFNAVHKLITDRFGFDAESFDILDFGSE
jgi:hypothetical protein